MPPDEVTDAATFYNSGRLGASRVIYNIHDLSEFVDSVIPANQRTPYFEGSTPENYWNGFSEDNFRGIAHILYLENAPNFREHLNYIFDYGRSYSTWRNLWDNHRLLMVEIRALIHNMISNMTVDESNRISNILTPEIDNMCSQHNISSRSIEFLARWLHTLYATYGLGSSIPFPTVVPYDYEVREDPIEGEDAVRVTTTPSGMWTSTDMRRGLYTLARNLNVPVPENLSDSEVEIFMRNYTAPSVITDEVITVPLPAGYADSVRRGDYEHTLGSTGGGTAGGFTGSYTTAGMTGGEVALNSQGVCNLNDLANAHSHNKTNFFVTDIDKAPSEQEIWESLQRLHPGMMETIQYILDDCTIDYKESNKTKRIDKMKQEMVPRIKGVLTCMDDRLDHYDKHYLNKWLWELINFAIDCNGPIPYRKLAPNIKKWNQKEEPRIKKLHTSLHIIPRLPE